MSASSKIGLCGVPYMVTEQDGQVIFEEQSGFHGCYTRLAFEWKSFGWYMLPFEARFEHIYAPHIVEAVKWLDENFTITWNKGTGTVSRKN